MPTGIRPAMPIPRAPPRRRQVPPPPTMIPRAGPVGSQESSRPPAVGRPGRGRDDGDRPPWRQLPARARRRVGWAQFDRGLRDAGTMIGAAASKAGAASGIGSAFGTGAGLGEIRARREGWGSGIGRPSSTAEATSSWGADGARSVRSRRETPDPAGGDTDSDAHPRTSAVSARGRSGRMEPPRPAKQIVAA